jgi:hypothetical protein
MWGRAVRVMATPPRRKTAPAGVAVASRSRDFSRPDAHPKVPQHRADGRNEMHTTAERLAADVAGAKEGADHRPPRPPSGTGRWHPAHRCLADYRHHHGARQQTTQAPLRLGQPLAPPRCPATGASRHRACPPRQPDHWPAPAQMGRACPRPQLQQPERLRRGEAEHPLLRLRRAHRRPPRRHNFGPPSKTEPPLPRLTLRRHARERAPPPPSGLRPTGPPAAAEEEGRRKRREEAGGARSHSCRLGLGDAGANRWKFSLTSI